MWCVRVRVVTCVVPHAVGADCGGLLVGGVPCDRIRFPIKRADYGTRCTAVARFVMSVRNLDVRRILYGVALASWPCVVYVIIV